MNNYAVHQQLAVELRKWIASVVLFNETVASRTGMSSSEMQTIHLLQLYGALTPSELATFTRLQSGSMTAVLDRLENLKFITRQPHPSDRRKILIHANVKRINAALAPHYKPKLAHTQTIIQAFTPAELAVVTRFIQQLRQDQT